MSEAKTKVELMSEMRELQQQYSAVAAKLKDIQFAEDKEAFKQRQLANIESYKAKYKFYANDKGEAKEIDWEEVEKLVKSSFDNYGKAVRGYALGLDQHGMEGLGHDNSFDPMVEEEGDARKYAERKARQLEFIEKAKQQQKK